MTNLEGLNYNSKLNIDDLTFASQATESAILERTRLVFGQGAITPARHGIVDSLDPRSANESDRPLFVYVNESNSNHVNVTSGTIVCPNGAIVSNETLAEDILLSSSDLLENDIYVLFIENKIVESDSRVTRYNTVENSKYIQSSDIIGCDTLSNFQNSVLYPVSRKDNLVAISVITVVSSSELQIDNTAFNYSFNRPWYSPVDVEHRSKIGSGVTTDTNPHGLTFNDLISGDLTLYEQMLSIGLILSKDDTIKGVSGFSCTETIGGTTGSNGQVSRVLVDYDGSVTSESRFGGQGSSYILLANYPTQITSFHLDSHKSLAIPFDHIRGTRIVVIPNPDKISSSASITYNRVLALEPPAQILSNTLTFGQPDTTNDLIFSGGIAISQMSNPSIDFEKSGPIPREYTVYSLADGTLIKAPEVLVNSWLLDDIGNTIQTVSATMFGPAKLLLGLSDAISTSNMSITARIYGTDVDGAKIQEDITFSSYVDSYTIINTQQVFSAVTNFQITNRIEDGPHSKIELWADLESETTLELNKLAKVSKINWNGKSITSIKDVRQITPVIPPVGNRFDGASEIVPAIIGAIDLLGLGGGGGAGATGIQGVTGLRGATGLNGGLTGLGYSPIHMVNQNELRFGAMDSYAALRAPNSIPSSVVWSLPTGDGTGGQALTTDGSGILYWSDITGSGSGQGATGIQGETGIQGNRGSTGISGVIGFQGIQGATGPLATVEYDAVNKSGSVMTGPLTMGSGNDLRFGDSDNSNYVGFKAPTNVPADKIWTLPATEGANGQYLMTDGAGNLLWITPSISGGSGGGVCQSVYGTVKGRIRCFAHDTVNNALYVGGEITQVGQILACNNIAKFDLNTNIWSLLTQSGHASNGVSGTIFALELDKINNVLYIGGSFNYAGDVLLDSSGVVKWDITTSEWVQLSGNNPALHSSGATIMAIKYDPILNQVYFGGDFINSSMYDLDNIHGIAKYDLQTTTWSLLGDATNNGVGWGGTFGSIKCMEIYNSILYVAGYFNYANASSNLSDPNRVVASCIATWDGTNWSDLGFSSINLASINTMIIKDNLIYCSGDHYNLKITLAIYDIALNSWFEIFCNAVYVPGVLTGNSVYDMAYDGIDSLYIVGNFLLDTDDTGTYAMYLAKITSGGLFLRAGNGQVYDGIYSAFKLNNTLLLGNDYFMDIFSLV